LALLHLTLLCQNGFPAASGGGSQKKAMKNRRPSRWRWGIVAFMALDCYVGYYAGRYKTEFNPSVGPFF
jgi:hypothetical protein